MGKGGRWSKNNRIEYEGFNIGKRNIYETIQYDNAYWMLTFQKYMIDKKDKDAVKIAKTVQGLSLKTEYFLKFLYEEKNDMNIFDVTENIAEDFMYYLSKNMKATDLSIVIYKIASFYDFLILNKKIDVNPFLKVKKLAFQAREKKKLYTNILTDEHIEKIRNDFPKDLKLYALFSLSTGIDNVYLRNIKWSNVDFEKRTVTVEGKIFYFSEEVLALLKEEKERRIQNGLNDCGYVFRSRVEANYNKNKPITRSMICSWGTEIGILLDVPNFRHLDFRHTAIHKFLTASGSTGMTSIIMNYPHLYTSAKLFIENGEKNNELLQEYKDICEI